MQLLCFALAASCFRRAACEAAALAMGLNGVNHTCRARGFSDENVSPALTDFPALLLPVLAHRAVILDPPHTKRDTMNFIQLGARRDLKRTFL